ncbi:MAG: class I SAM-dependent methyltransferase [Xanthomonadales bacterium]|nr:class I SAM-dependent methyltransferase [Xanthomonadales bacterium]
MNPIKRMMLLLAIPFAASAQAFEHNEALYGALAAQDAEVQARYAARHPGETLAFFGIAPGMTVIEGLPGGGWYTKVLLPYLGSEGAVIGADYAADMFPLFGFFSQEFIDSKDTWVEDWPAEASGWAGEDGAALSAFQFGSMPESMHGTADAALMVRAMHNLFRFEGQGGYLTAALADIHAVLKPGGVFGVVQHQAPDHMSAEWANGSKGYVKKAALIEAVIKAGFVFEAESSVNENPHDTPGADDFVWRLPPTLVGTEEGSPQRARMLEIGESNRMTLRFRKPEQAAPSESAE